MSEERTPPMEGLIYEAVEGIDKDADYTAASKRELRCGLSDATVATSLSATNEGKHKIVLDIDLPAKLVPSTTEGHFHLFIDHELTWAEYKELLEAMGSVGLLEPGYVGASLERGHTAVSLPWVRKEVVEDDRQPER